LLDGDRIWATIDGVGVSRFDGTTWTNWASRCDGCTDQFFNPGQGVAAVLDAEGYKWIAFWNWALERFDDRGAPPLWEHKWSPPPPVTVDPDSARHTWGWASCLDSLHHVWFGSDSPLIGSPEGQPIGLDVYANGVFETNYQTSNSLLRGNQIRALTVDKFGVIYVGYLSKGLDSFNPPGPIGSIHTIIQESDLFPDVQGVVAHND